MRGWLAANLPADIRDKVTGYRHLSKDDYIRWHKILAAKGWSVPHWPVEWGGTGWNITQRYIYDEEFGLAGAPGAAALRPEHVRVGAAALRHAASRRQRFLPRIREGDDFWVQGYSEPGAGSDLAALKTRAERQRRPLRRQRPEDLDHAGPLRRLDLLPGAHRQPRPRSGRRASASC